MNRVFVVVIDSYDGECSSIVDIEVFSTLDAAREHLGILKEDFKKDIIDWNNTDIYTIEEDEDNNFFTWYETGYYDQNHYCLDIYERTIHDGTIKLGGE